MKTIDTSIAELNCSHTDKIHCNTAARLRSLHNSGSQPVRELTTKRRISEFPRNQHYRLAEPNRWNVAILEDLAEVL